MSLQTAFRTIPNQQMVKLITKSSQSQTLATHVLTGRTGLISQVCQTSLIHNAELLLLLLKAFKAQDYFKAYQLTNRNP